MPTRKTIFRILLSSPSDLPAERKIVENIVNEINETHKASHYGLDLICWENDVSPEIILDSGQKIIDKVFAYDESDLLIGMFHKKVGTPVLGSASGTIHEIDRAIQSYKEHSIPSIMLYFKKVSVRLGETSKEQRDEYAQVESKRKEYMKLGIVQQFGSTKEFEKLCRKHILQFFNTNIAKYAEQPIDSMLLVKTRAEFERMEEIVKKATHDIFILGINLESVVNMSDILLSKANAGVKIKLLALDPMCPAVEHFNINNIDTDYRRNKIITNLKIIQNKFCSCDNITLRVVGRVFVAGCTGIDIEEKGRIVAQQYLNNVGTAKAPILDIYAAHNPQWFSTYRDYLDKLWDISREYTI